MGWSEVPEVSWNVAMLILAGLLALFIVVIILAVILAIFTGGTLFILWIIDPNNTRRTKSEE